MRTPDARPAGETAEQRALRALLDTIDSCSGALKPRLDGYRDACKAEARAALLRDAPVVWVATDDRGDSWCCTAATPAEADGKGEWLPLEGPLTQPGTVRRYALVPHPEGEPT